MPQELTFRTFRLEVILRNPTSVSITLHLQDGAGYSAHPSASANQPGLLYHGPNRIRLMAKAWCQRHAQFAFYFRDICNRVVKLG